MYKGYNLELNRRDIESDVYYTAGLKLYNENKTIINNKLKDFIDADGALKAHDIEANWFPEFSADIFLSHSHLDERMAITLAGFLYNKFGLMTFIDSCLWGYSLELLKMIDNKFCVNKSTGNYDYPLRNRSTSYVHMMLTVALAKTIDKSEVVFFLNTPASLTPFDVIGESRQTLSPWIYTEISLTRLIRKKSIDEHRMVKKAHKATMESFDSALVAKFNVDIDHLVRIDIDDLARWLKSSTSQSLQGYDALDDLYEKCP